MAFRPEKKSRDYKALKTALINAGIQVDQNALFQALDGLIDGAGLQQKSIDKKRNILDQINLNKEVRGILPVDNGGVVSGVYVPTLTNVSNLDASTAFRTYYVRMGDIVSVSGKVDVDPTVITTGTELRLTLPIQSKIQNDEEVSGVAYSDTVVQGAAIHGDVTNNTARLQFISVGTAQIALFFVFNYLVR